MTLGITTFIETTFSIIVIVTLSITILSIMTLHLMTNSITILSIMRLNLKTLGIMVVIVMTHIITNFNFVKNDLLKVPSYIMLTVVMLIVVVANVVAPYDHSRPLWLRHTHHTNRGKGEK